MENLDVLLLVAISGFIAFMLRRLQAKQSELQRQISMGKDESLELLRTLSTQQKELYTEILTELRAERERITIDSEMDTDDHLYDEAKRVVMEAGKCSTSFLQRKLSIGYARAARLMDMLEEKGIIESGEGAMPRKVANPITKSETASTKNNGGRERKILFIDDDKFLLHMYSIKLTKAGFEVVTWERIPDGDWVSKILEIKPDLISTDILMPGLNGFEAIKILKSDPRTKNIPVVGFDNLGQKEDIEQAKKMGADAYFIKATLPPDDLVKKYIEILNNPRTK